MMSFFFTFMFFASFHLMKFELIGITPMNYENEIGIKTYTQTDRRTDRQTNRWIDAQTYADTQPANRYTNR